jgi:hypothetical protein
VQVLAHQDGAAPGAGLVHDRRRDLVRLGPAVEQLRELAADLVGDVRERPQRARGEQRVAPAPEDATGLLPEAPQQRGLAAARLAGEHHERARAAVEHDPTGLAQRGQLRSRLSSAGSPGPPMPPPIPPA